MSALSLRPVRPGDPPVPAVLIAFLIAGLVPAVDFFEFVAVIDLILVVMP